MFRWVESGVLAPASPWSPFRPTGAASYRDFCSRAILSAIYSLPCFSGGGFDVLGWRGLFIVAILPAFLVLYIRSKVSESPGWTPSRVHSVDQVARRPAGGANIRRYLYAIALMAAAATFSHGTQDLYPTFLRLPHGFSVHEVSMIAIVYNVGAILGCLCGGTLSQWLGRRREVVLAAVLALALALMPFWAAASGAVALAGTAFCMQFLVQSMFGAMPAHLNEISPRESRATFPGFTYQFGNFLAAEDADSLLVDQILSARKRRGRPVVIGLCGAQGSGKSTTAGRLAGKLQAGGHATAVVSIDDFYLTRSERTALAESTHPLLATRGVPGTHDVELAIHTLLNLLQASAADTVPIPQFDKSRDDRLPEGQWTPHRGSVEVVLLEGWCVGARPQPQDALTTPLNQLEREEDTDGRWRRYVNQRLEGDYADLFSLVDTRILLRPPDFETAYSWRAQQEAGLSRTGQSLSPMTDVELRRFIAHYERLTRWILLDEPAHVIVHLDSRRVPIQYCLKEFEPPTPKR